MFRQFFLLKRIFTWAAALATVVTLAMPASAAVIQQTSFGIGGAFKIPAGQHLGTTDSITIGNGGTIIVTQADTYDLAGIVTWGQLGTLQNIPSITAFAPIAGFLTLASGVSLDLNELHIVSRQGPAPGFLNLFGRGILHAPGFDATEALFTWSGTTSDNLGFTFAVHTSAVPEPVPVALMGLGLLGVAFLRRRQQATRA
jgi:hypothetical protein